MVDFQVVSGDAFSRLGLDDLNLKLVRLCYRPDGGGTRITL